jgi:hypothetical protein
MLYEEKLAVSKTQVNSNEKNGLIKGVAFREGV